MKKKLLFIILLTTYVALVTRAQEGPIKLGTMPYTIKAKEHIPVVSCLLVAGVAEGIMDQLQFHYDKPDQFWNPDVSWRNKYYNNTPSQGLTFWGKYMPMFTDGWHLMKGINHITLLGAITFKGIYGEKKKWWIYLVEGATYWAINRIGFQIGYKIIKL